MKKLVFSSLALALFIMGSLMTYHSSNQPRIQAFHTQQLKQNTFTLAGKTFSLEEKAEAYAKCAGSNYYEGQESLCQVGLHCTYYCFYHNCSWIPASQCL